MKKVLLSNHTYWKRRVKQYGKHSVLNILHPPEEYDNITNRQKEILFPLFRKQLSSDEKVLLDFGCGPGRFTKDLAEIINGRAIGLDIVKELLDMAQKSQNVEYCLLKNNIIPAENEAFDVIWICLVLGGIKDEDLPPLVGEINRVLKKGGLLFLVENTTKKPSGKFWYFKNYEFYKTLLNFMILELKGEYLDLDENITIMSGRKS